MIDHILCQVIMYAIFTVKTDLISKIHQHSKDILSKWQAKIQFINISLAC